MTDKKFRFRVTWHGIEVLRVEMTSYVLQNPYERVNFNYQTFQRALRETKTEKQTVFSVNLILGDTMYA